MPQQIKVVRHNGLSISTCNVVFWTIVIPIVSFWCELWVLQGTYLRGH